MTQEPLRWTNWGGTYSCSPTRIQSPVSEEEIVAIVRGAAERGERLKVIVYGMTLGYSRRKHYTASLDETQVSIFEAVEGCLLVGLTLCDQVAVLLDELDAAGQHG